MMLQIENLTKSYGRFKAVDGVSLSIKDGSIAVLMGPNGAGKSTLIKSIAALLRYKGEILIDGKPNRSLEAKRSLGYIPEMPAIYYLLTVSEHIQFIQRAYGVFDDEHVNRLLEDLEMTDKQKKLGKELSKGMQQKLSIICALASRPRTIVFDEPLVGLDPHAIKSLKQTILALKADGCAILISTHMADSVEGLWDTVHIMKDGKILKSVDESVGQMSLEDLYFSITEAK